jgi:hypothetical protein
MSRIFRHKAFAPQILAHPPIIVAEADPPTLCGGNSPRRFVLILLSEAKQIETVGLIKEV